MSTDVIKRICIHPTFGKVWPGGATPAAGEFLVPANLKSGGWFTIGSVQQGEDGDIDSESVKSKPYKEGVSINPPGSQTRQGYVLRKSGIDEVTFRCYDVSRGVFALDSTVAEVIPGSGIFEQQGLQVYRTMIVEVGGLYFDWYPRVMLTLGDEAAGYGPGDDAVAKLSLTATVMDYDGTGGDLPVVVKSGRWRVYKTGQVMS